MNLDINVVSLLVTEVRSKTENVHLNARSSEIDEDELRSKRLASILRLHQYKIHLLKYMYLFSYKLFYQ